MTTFRIPQRCSLFIGFLFSCQLLIAQVDNDQVLNCGSAHIMLQKMQSDPSLRLEQGKYEQALREYLTNPSVSVRSNMNYTLPVVVHIIHDNGSENISDALVQQGIDDLNEAFANTGYYDQGTGVATGIQFCLATQDPEGNATTGINRLVDTLTNVNMDRTDRILKNLIRWDPSSYINVWIVREICRENSCAVAGYAYLPGAHGGPVDGIVMESRFMGSNKSNSTVLVHEMGHYLGLYHTFEGGCQNDDCMVNGDRVCDTPPDQSTAAVSCNSSANTCDTDTNSGFTVDQNDMFWNYMDYGRFSCYSAFTQGQTNRMIGTIENRRSSLLESVACFPPCSVTMDVNISPQSAELETGETLTLSASGNNLNTFQWYLNGEAINTGSTFSQMFTEAGNYQVMVQADNNEGGCLAVYDTIPVKVTCTIDVEFMVDTTQILMGESITVTNTSSNADQFEWRLNGDPITGGNNFTQTFSQPGIYQITLLGSNDFCSASARAFIQVIDPDFCSPTVHQVAILSSLKSEQSFEILENGNIIRGNLEYYGPNFEPIRAKTFDWLENNFRTRDGTRTKSNLKNGNTYFASYFEVEGEDRLALRLFKLGPAGNLLWAKEYEIPVNTTDLNLFINHFDISVNENDEVVLAAWFGDSSLRYSAFFKFDGSGNLIWQKGIELFRIGELIMDNDGTIFAIGDFAGNSNFHQIICIESDGLVRWNKRLDSTIYGDVISRYTLQQFVLNNQGGLIFGSTFRNFVTINSLDRDGNLIWSNRLNIEDFQTANFFSLGLIDLEKGPSGTYYLVANFSETILSDPFNPFILRRNYFCIMNFDNDANFIWQKVYEKGESEFGSFLNQNNLEINPINNNLIIDGGEIFERDSTLPIPGGVIAGDQFFIGDALGNFGECLPGYDSTIVFEPSNFSFEPFASIEINLDSWADLDIQVLDQPSIAVAPLCYDELIPELALEFESAQLCGGFLSVRAQLCNTGNLGVEANLPFNIYNRNPQDGGVIIDQRLIPFDIPADTCMPFEFEMESVQFEELYGILSAQSYFIQLENPDENSRGFIFECNFENNVDSIPITFSPYTPPNLDLGEDTTVCNLPITVHASDQFVSYLWSTGAMDSTITITQPGTYILEANGLCNTVVSDTITVDTIGGLILDLGPDQAFCDNGIVVLNAGSGFSSYEWQDGSTDSTFTAWDAGDYWLSAIDQCGNIYQDTVTIQVDPATEIDLGPDRTICQNESIQLVAPAGFSNYQWYPSTYFDCDTCRSVTFQASGFAQDTALVIDLQANNTRDCISSDSLVINIQQGFEFSDTISICQGDTIWVNGLPVFAEGLYADTLQTNAGCDSIRSVLVTVSEAFSSTETITICAGDSAFIFNQWASAPGVYTNTIRTSSGCDSLAEIVLELNAAGQSFDTLTICSGDSFNWYDQTISSSGTYQERVPVNSLCDSIVNLTVFVEPTIASDTTITICSGDSIFIFDRVFKEIGTYSILGKTADGCDSMSIVTLITEDDLSVINPLPASYSIAEGEQVTIAAEIPGGLNFTLEWFPAKDLSCTDCPNPIASPSTTTQYTLVVTNESGCQTSFTTEVIVEPAAPIFVPNIFSPNSDGENDWFYIQAAPNVTQINEFRVFDRWGDLVYERNNFPANEEKYGWDGQVNSQYSNSGVYVYTLTAQLEDGRVIKKYGEVLLLR